MLKFEGLGMGFPKTWKRELVTLNENPEISGENGFQLSLKSSGLQTETEFGLRTRFSVFVSDGAQSVGWIL